MEKLKFNVAYCPNCNCIGSAHVILNDEFDSHKKIQDFFGPDSEYSQMSLDSVEEYEKNKVERNLIELQYSYSEYERCHHMICQCKPFYSGIRTFADACHHLGISDVIPNFNNAPEKLRKQLEAHYKLAIITLVLNEGKEINWNAEKWEEYDAYYPGEFCIKKNADDRGLGVIGYLEEPERSPGILCYFIDDGPAYYAGAQFRDLYLDYYQYPETYLNRYNNE